MRKILLIAILPVTLFSTWLLAQSFPISTQQTVNPVNSIIGSAGIGVANVGGVTFSQNYTPAISFGGGTTGITYSTQLGRFNQVGKLCTFPITIILTSKGSSTGVAAVSLPIAAVNVSTLQWSFATIGNFAAAVTQSPTIILQNNSTSGGIFNVVSGVATQLSDTGFTNTSSLVASGTYETN